MGPTNGALNTLKIIRRPKSSAKGPRSRGEQDAYLPFRKIYLSALIPHKTSLLFDNYCERRQIC